MAALRNKIGAQSRRDLWPYIRKGYQKVLASTPDPAASLQLFRELGLDDFAHEIGMGEYVTELEQKAASYSPAFDGVAASQSAVASAGAPPASSASFASQDPAALASLEKVENQAYHLFLAAQERGDTDAAAEHYRVYLRARAGRGATP